MSYNRDYDRGGGGYGDRYGGGGYGGGHDAKIRRLNHGRSERGGGRFEDRGGGRYGGGGRGGPRPVRPVDSTDVVTNCFETTFTNDKIEVFEFEVRIFKAKKQKDEQKRPVRDAKGKFMYEKGKQILKQDDEGDRRFEVESGDFSRKILLKLRDTFWQNGRYVVDDGFSKAYSPTKLFDEERRDFHVTVKDDCPEDAEYADRVQNAHFLVELRKVGRDGRVTYYPRQVGDLIQVRTFMSVLYRSALESSGMKLYGKSPRVVHLPVDSQPRFIKSRRLRDLLRDEQKYRPSIGIVDLFRASADGAGTTGSADGAGTTGSADGAGPTGHLFLNLDQAVEFRMRDKDTQNDWIPLLTSKNGRWSIADVPISDPHRPIVDQNEQNRIKLALLKLTINVKYNVPIPNGAEEKLKQKFPDKEENWIQKQLSRKYGFMVRHGRRMPARGEQPQKNKSNKDEEGGEEEENKGLGKNVIWNPRDPNEYSFMFGRGESRRRITVEEYFRERWEVTLKYPYMPLIYTGKQEWYPIEFLFQAEAPLKENVQRPKNVQSVLAENDEIAGHLRIQHISLLYRYIHKELRRNCLGISDVLKQYGIDISDKPKIVKAKVLPLPKVYFGSQEVIVRNGSWNLLTDQRRKVIFTKPADLNAFAVADFSGRRAGISFISEFLHVVREHGMTIPRDFDNNLAKSLVEVSRVSRGGLNVNNMQDTIIAAITKARSYFTQTYLRRIYDTYKVGIIGKVQSPGAQERGDSIFDTDCVLVPGTAENSVGVILHRDTRFSTHKLSNGGDARLMYRCGRDTYDPFDTRLMGLRDVETVFMTEDGREYTGVNATPSFEAHIDFVQVVSILFVILPELSTSDYGIAKLLSHFDHGIPSQCIVAEKFLNQKQKGQYCSNIAIKVNAKLANCRNKATTWTCKPTSSDQFESDAAKPSDKHGPTWIREVDTIVIGLSISNMRQGEDYVSIVAASATVDNCCIRIQQDVCMSSKEKVIDREVVAYLTQSMLCARYANNYDIPRRILVYRDGVSDELCYDVLVNEVPGIRSGFKKFCHSIQRDIDVPPITFVVCQTGNSLKVVPASEEDGVGRGGKNVHTGTCIDRDIINAPLDVGDDSMCLEEEKMHGGYDFVLVAQGSGKGTSKPVNYKCILNENAIANIYGGSPLTRDFLERATFELSYLYSTATKAVRLVSVLKYSNRLAETVHKYGKQVLPNLFPRHLDSMRENTDNSNEFVRAARVFTLPNEESSFSLLKSFTASLPNIENEVEYAPGSHLAA